MLQVGDVETPFIPLPQSKLMMDIADERDRIDIVLDKIYNMVTSATTRGRFANQVCTGAAIQACLGLLEGNGKCNSNLCRWQNLSVYYIVI